ncbi:hypothetical protein V2J09_003655 [Rumex salicifolius]
MTESKDPGIKLFGKTIQMEPNDDVSHAIEVVAVDCEQSSCDHNNNNSNNCLSCSNESVSPTSLCDKNTAAPREGSTDSKQEDDSIGKVLEEQSRCVDKEWSSSMASKKEEEETETSGPEEKPLKKPDKLLPCPRCNSMDTKFCYFNNYNVSQPRHLCKKCQRYWTAGGTMRNVPVGAGRRKNKSTTNSSSSSRYIVIPDTSNGVIYPAFRANAIGSESPLCESVTSDLTIEENPAGLRGPCFQAPPWPNPWTALPFPVPVYAMPPYWSCGVPGSWVQPPCATTDFNSTSSGPGSPLGKHPRENKERRHGEEKRTETKVLVPKTLRFDDPSEAARSSIWTTLGIKHENTSSLDSGVFFRGLQPKGSRISSGFEMSSLLQANPAAVSRSLTYHENVE